MSIFVVSNGSTGSLKRRFINENVNESINDNEWHGLAVGFIVFPYVLGMRHVPMLSTSFTSITAPLTLLFVGLPPTGRNGIQSHLQSAQSQPGKRATHGRVRASRQRRNYVSPSLFFFFLIISFHRYCHRNAAELLDCGDQIGDKRTKTVAD